MLALQLKISLIKGYHMYAVVSINKVEEVYLTQYPILSKIPNAFLDSCLGFFLSVIWSYLLKFNPIQFPSLGAPYHMTTTKLFLVYTVA